MNKLFITPLIVELQIKTFFLIFPSYFELVLNIISKLKLIK